MLKVVNDNKLGSHVIIEHVAVPPLRLDFPAHKIVRFKDRNDYVPDFHKASPLAYNPGEKPGPQNSYTNNWQKTTTKTEPTTQESALQNWFRL